MNQLERLSRLGSLITGFLFKHIDMSCDIVMSLQISAKFVAQENSKRCESTKLIEADTTKLINGHFADWLEQKVIQSDGANITEKVRALAAKPNRYGVRYSGYVINGFRFHTMSHESGHVTENRGVVNIAENGVRYYGRLTDILELSYNYYKVVFFNHDWYDVYHKVGIQTDEFGFILVNKSRKIHTGDQLEDDPFVFASQV